MASSAEDDESDIGEISGGEDPDMDFTEGDGLRRMSPGEAPQLVGAEGEGRGGEGGSGSGSGSGGTDSSDDDYDASGGGGVGGGTTDPLDDESEESVSLSELDESHGSDPGPCNFGCSNDFTVDCECECDRCMFKHLSKYPPNYRKFNKLLRRNFQWGGSSTLVDPKQRIFRARRPYDYTQDSTTYTCSQMIPWGVGIRKWDKPCPTERQRERGRYQGRVLPCDEIFCYRHLPVLSERYEDRYGKGLHEDLVNKVRFPDHPGIPRPFVCERHIEDSKEYFHMGANADNLYNAHLIRYCKIHEAQLQAQYGKTGRTTCTCRNVDFTRWQCRSCFTEKVEKLQRHFRRRVNPNWRGCADTTITNSRSYQKDWKGVRRMLQRLHPCLKGRCGRPRLRGLARNEVLDCRCCGGFIVQPTQLRRSARLAKRSVVTYAEESSQGTSSEGSSARSS